MSDPVTITVGVFALAIGLGLGIAIGIWWERYKPGEVDDGPLN